MEGSSQAHKPTALFLYTDPNKAARLTLVCQF
jgi:hypothetical protein